MNHEYIAEQALVERYFRGELPAAEEAAFEAHFFACEQCQEDLEAAKELRRGLQAEAAYEAAAPASISARQATWWSRRQPLELGLLAAALLVALSLPLLVGWQRYQQLEGRVAAARATAEEIRRDLDRERQRSSSLGERLATSERDRQLERQRLEAQLQAPVTEPVPTRLAKPLADVAVYLLATVRDAAMPIPVVGPAGDSAEAFTLAVDAGPDAVFGSYRIEVLDRAGQRRFRRDGLQLNALEVVMVTFPVDFLPPGEYRLELAGLDAEGAATALSTHPFQVAGNS